MKYLQRFEAHLNISDVDDRNMLKIIKDLLFNGDVEKIANVMTDYNSKCSSQSFKEANELIDKSKYKEEINNLIRGKLGIFG